MQQRVQGDESTLTRLLSGTTLDEQAQAVVLEVAAGVAQKAGSADGFDVLFGRAAPVRKALSTVASWP